MMRHKATKHPHTIEEIVDDDDTESSEDNSENSSEGSDHDSDTSSDTSSDESSETESVTSNDDTIPEKYNLWNYLKKQAFKNKEVADKYDKVSETLISNGVNQDEVERDTLRVVLPDIRKHICERYTDMLLLWHYAEGDDTHQKVIGTKRKLIEDEDYDEEEAVRYAVKKRRYLIQKETSTLDDDIPIHDQDDHESQHSGEDET